MPRKSIWGVSVLLLAGCGSSGEAPPPIARTAPTPAAATRPAAQGEFVFRGQLSPKVHRPVALHGRYRVRFVQYAPEDAQHDFSGDTSFVATLDAAGPGVRPEVIKLFRRAARSGETTITADGRYALDVSFGDYPYAVRLTPTG